MGTRRDELLILASTGGGVRGVGTGPCQHLYEDLTSKRIETQWVPCRGYSHSVVIVVILLITLTFLFFYYSLEAFKRVNTVMVSVTVPSSEVGP